MTERAQLASRPGATSVPRLHHGYAFGLDLTGSFPAAGLLDGRRGGAGRPTRVEIVGAADVEGAWPAQGATRLREVRGDDGTVLFSVDEHPDAGYRFAAPAYGDYVLSRDGTLVLAVPSDAPAWDWQGFLVGQLLPGAAVLHGLEALHASAVELRGCAAAITGPPSAGKSSLAANLVRRGAGFLADDVVALEAADGRVLVHPGAGLISVRRAEAEALGPAAMRELGPRLGEDHREIRLSLERPSAALPVRAVYVLERGVHDGDLSLVEDPDPRLLFGASFWRILRTPERLARQLALFGQLARTAAVVRVRIPASVNAVTVAEALEAHALALPPHGGRE